MQHYEKEFNEIRDATDIRPNNQGFSNIPYPVGYRDIQPDARNGR
jgi:hypothetical protein